MQLASTVLARFLAHAPVSEYAPLLEHRGTQICLTFNTEITEVNLSAFVYRLCHEDFSSIYSPIDQREIFMKQAVDKCK